MPAMPAAPITINGAIETPGESSQYVFNLSSSIRLLFDSLTNNSDLYWDLVGPRGAIVSGRGFTSSDSAGLSGNPIFDLAAGTYTLTVYASKDTTGAYSFRLIDVSTAPVLISGAVVSG